MLNKYIYISEGEYYNYGKIVYETNELILVRMDSGVGPTIQRLFCLHSLAHMEVMFFDSQEQLDAWLKWLETPSETKGPKIVSIKDKHLMSIKGPLKVKIEGPQGSGKTTLLTEIVKLLEKRGWRPIVDEDKHTIEIQKGE